MVSNFQPVGKQSDVLPFAEFVILMASLMALNALAIDSMLPALPDIGRAFNIAEANNRQLVISSYLLGAGLGAPIHGPLADRFGRRPVLLTGLACYVVFAIGCVWMPSFYTLIAVRMGQGFFAAAAFVLAVSIIRDRFVGDEMARLMSLVSITFMVIPVVAPMLGQAVLAISEWHSIFYLLATLGTALFIWTWVRLPETLRPEDVLHIAPRRILANWWRMACHRQTMAYMLASGIFFGALFGFVNSSQQIFSVTFKAGDIFPYAFAVVAGSMALSNFINSRLVRRFGARRMSHSALLCFLCLSILQIAIHGLMSSNLVVFLAVVACTMSMVGFVGANFGSIAMEPFGHMAGAASSFQAFVRMTCGALIGGTIGHFFDGSSLPLAVGFLFCGTVALALVFFAEGGVLMRRHGLHPREAFDPNVSDLADE